MEKCGAAQAQTKAAQAQTQTAKDGAVCFSGKVGVREKGVDSNLHVVGMVGITGAVAGKDGRGKALVEERHPFPDDGEGLSRGRSGPKVYWVGFDKERGSPTFGAQEPISMCLKRGGLTTLKGLRVDQNLMALGVVGSVEEGQPGSPNLSKRGLTQATNAGALKGLRAPEVKISGLEWSLNEDSRRVGSTAQA